MPLIGNGVRLGGGAQRFGSNASIYAVSDRSTNGSRRCFWDSQATGAAASKSSIPDAYRQPGAWVLSPKAGGLSCRYELQNSCDVTASIVGGKALAAGITLACDMTATGQLIGAIAAAISIVGDLTASATGAASISTSISLAADATGTLGALAGMTAALNITTTLVGTPSATANIACDIKSYTDLTVEGLRDAIWQAIASQNNLPGTMGELLNVAGAGGLPNEFQTILRELYKLAGLDPAKPLVVTTTSRKVPADGTDIDQTIDDTAGTITVTRQ